MSAQAGRSLYETLGVPPTAQKQDIRNAYRKLALRHHPDKNQGDSSATISFQEIQAAYETLSEDDRRAKYDVSAGFSSHRQKTTRAWREPSYGPCAQDPPPFWSVELRAMTVQKCARMTRIRHLEGQIADAILTLDELVAAEDRAVAQEEERCKARNRSFFSFIKTRSKANAQQQQRRRRQRETFLAESARINNNLETIKHELRVAVEEHKSLLERDHGRKTWWARERIRRFEEENRRAATTTTSAEADAARRRAEREHRDGVDTDAARRTAADDNDEYDECPREREREREDEDDEDEDDEDDEARRRAQAARRRKRAEDERLKREKVDPDVVRRRREEALEWLAGQRRANKNADMGV